MKPAVVALTVLSASAAAHAQFSTGFEAPTYVGSAAGTPLAGQDAWFTPVTVPVSNPANVHTYAGNTYGFVQNPSGNDQFAVTRNDGTSLGRGQHANVFTPGVWTIGWDFAAIREGALPAINNVGSFSLQDSTLQRFFQSLYVWDDIATGSAYDSNFIWFDAAGVQNGATGVLPGPEWNALPLNTWFRSAVTVDFTSNQILAISLTNLHTSATTVVNPANAYMHGGTNPTRPLPTGVRLFSGGGAGVNNDMGWDNVTAVPSPGAALVLLGGGLLAGRRRRR